MFINPTIVVDQFGHDGTFSTTSLLNRGNHPDRSAGWPAWAVAAFIHTLGNDLSDHPDLYVTYISDVTSVSTKENRTSISLIEIDVRDLYTWDWGPVRQDVRSRLVANTDPAEAKSYTTGSKGLDGHQKDEHHDFNSHSV